MFIIVVYYLFSASIYYVMLNIFRTSKALPTVVTYTQINGVNGEDKIGGKIVELMLPLTRDKYEMILTGIIFS